MNKTLKDGCEIASKQPLSGEKLDFLVDANFKSARCAPSFKIIQNKGNCQSMKPTPNQGLDQKTSRCPTQNINILDKMRCKTIDVF